jgi:uncharacterized protein HemX
VIVDVECQPNECKPGIPVGDERCDEEEPALPPELPVTGPMEAALAIVAILALTIGVVYWYKSRMDMRKVALGENHEHHAAHTVHTETASPVTKPKKTRFTRKSRINKVPKHHEIYDPDKK